MTATFPSFFDSRKSPSPPAALAASAARLRPEEDLQQMQQMQQGVEPEIGGGVSPRAADAADAAGRDREIPQTCGGAAGGNGRPVKVARVTPCASSAPATWQDSAVALEAACLPRDWAEPFAKLLRGSPPGYFSPTRWANVVAGATIFADEWATQALRLGWSAEEVFGLDDVAPAARHDRKGLAWSLSDGKRIAAIDQRGADILTGQGSKQRFYRRVKHHTGSH